MKRYIVWLYWLFNITAATYSKCSTGQGLLTTYPHNKTPACIGIAHFLLKPHCVSIKRSPRCLQPPRELSELPHNRLLTSPNWQESATRTTASATLLWKSATIGSFFFRFPAFISPSVSRQGAVTQPLISKQQWAGGDRFAKTNNLISGSTALISSAQNSLEKRVRNITSARGNYVWTGFWFHIKMTVAELNDIVGLLSDVGSTSQCRCNLIL